MHVLIEPPSWSCRRIKGAERRKLLSRAPAHGRHYASIGTCLCPDGAGDDDGDVCFSGLPPFLPVERTLPESSGSVPWLRSQVLEYTSSMEALSIVVCVCFNSDNQKTLVHNNVQFNIDGLC